MLLGRHPLATRTLNRHTECRGDLCCVVRADGLMLTSVVGSLSGGLLRLLLAPELLHAFRPLEISPDGLRFGVPAVGDWLRYVATGYVMRGHSTVLIVK
jgi:hypothetical protein